MEWTRGSLLISDDQARLQLDKIHEMLSRTYWASERPREKTARAIEGSLCLGLYEGDRQLGFLRVVTDYACFAWVCDVVIDENERGRGLGKWLMDCLVTHPALAGCSMSLRTKDAHGLYRQYGFELAEAMKRPASDAADGEAPVPANAGSER
ncbi:N-acetyltransferase [Paenibacillus sp. J31TS4]|uniref:GNAT family N-acetyltransferase n=1 Tax=Paenibacillus sp. J31TS4 TaxID=2807195 RepID=UPI001B08DE32|nr:GNAT family N-acetyltransferase [Paenibacillus sp. J31TS4]GIP38071.1 N-acetyltransferase [Paenibacillus sp. J31TS4]